MNLMGKNHPYYGKSVITNFPGSPHTMGFVSFFHNMGNRWRNSSISHMTKYIIGWKSNGKKALILWEKYEYRFPKLYLKHSVLLHFPVLWKIDENIHFPCDSIG